MAQLREHHQPRPGNARREQPAVARVDYGVRAAVQDQRAGELRVGGRTVRLDEVSEPRPGQRFAFVMDTRLCDAAFALADRADMLVCESTFANAEAALARDYGRMTAGQAGQIAAQAGARLLVLTHFSQRYEHGPDGDRRLADEAAAAFGGEVLLARDLDRIPVPARHPGS